MSRATDRYFVLYRTGGRARWRWNRILELFTLDLAQAEVHRINKQGFACAIFDMNKTPLTEVEALPFDVEDVPNVVYFT